MKIKRNISKILSESYKWRNRELLEKKDANPQKLTFRKLIYSNIYYGVFGFIIAISISDLFSEKITTFLMTSLSIFIGLFISILILIFDKFLNRNESYKRDKNLKDNPDLKVNYIRTRNFTRRFVFVLLESLIVAFVTILLLLITLILNKAFTRDIFEYQFVTMKEIKPLLIWIFLQNTFVVFIKTLTIVLMIRFSMFLFFLFGSLGEYMKGVLYGKVDL